MKSAQSEYYDPSLTRSVNGQKVKHLVYMIIYVIKDFLPGRSLIRVSIEGKLSSIKDVLSGIPQDYVKSRVTIFADDLKLIGNASDRTIIDKDLENLELWEKRWLLKFNIDKCHVLHLKFNDNLNLEYKIQIK